ncbi:putative 2OG-Fe(II) oxygenase [Rhodoferax sp.]|uniref:putative 2OG-Fe(II) oxygenase n=1 Tax=Rhodoferax sp. TaxID=50421 RepID=UPI0025E3DCEC|nr:putative 2OG-Fe(II) oxygenase [Rhodoferax sp.]
MYCKEFNISKSLGFFKTWGNIYRKGSGILPHNHKNGIVSGVLYISGPFLKETGDTSYLFPKNRNQSIQVTRPFVSGNLVLHSSKIFHYMPPYEAEANRISLAIDFSENEINSLYLPFLKLCEENIT